MKKIVIEFSLADTKTEKAVREDIIKILCTTGCQEISYNGHHYPDKPYYEAKGIKIPECINKGRRQPGMQQRREMANGN